MDSLERQWIEERDNQLVAWFAQGRSDEDILLMSQSMGYDLSIEGIGQKRAELFPRVSDALAKRGVEILKEVPRTHVVTRVHELNGLCDLLWRALSRCEQDAKWSPMARLAGTLVLAHNAIRQEVDRVPQIETSQERKQRVLQAMTMEELKQVREHGDAVSQIMERAANRADGIVIAEVPSAD